MLKNSKRKKIVFLLSSVLYILIATFFVNGILIDDNRLYHKRNVEFDDKNGDLKSAGVYTNITIDDRPGSPNNWAWAKTQPWSSGSGTLLDPYIIEGQILNLSASAHGIRISNSTSSYFEIRNNIAQWNELTNTLTMTGIFLSNTSKGKIVTNTIYNITKGIHLNNCSNVDILNNTIYDQTTPINHMVEGILVEYSYFLNISKNKVFDIIQAGNGIFLNNSFFNNISANKIYNIENSNGMKLENSNFNDVTENDIFSNEVGITLQASHNNTFSGNNVSNNADHGLVISQSHNNTLTGNMVKDNSQNGIQLFESDNNTLSRNPINNNGNYGIIIEYSINNIILGNIMTRNLQGIFMSFSNFSIIIKNNASKNNYGMSIDESNNNTISGNVISNNSQYGIIFSGNSNNNTFSGNTVNNNDVIGIYLEDYCDLNQFTNNILNNNLVGFQIDLNNDNNSIFENFLLNNGKHAIDGGTDNKWNSTIIGNYWDNYTGVDADHNGIGDTNHIFNGGIDYLPIWDVDLPSINIVSPSDNDLVGRTAPSFIVEVTDLYLENMWYTIDDHVTNVLFTTNETFDQTLWEILWDSIAEMDFIYIIFYANDTFGNLGSNNVSVIKSVAPIISIISPLEDTVFGAVAPNFTVEVVESNLEFM